MEMKVIEDKWHHNYPAFRIFYLWSL